ncbi:vWA domain-containing protein [Comamonas guangdongensis]|uniref:VWA domain-containing protein n=1 Tax=Comamonas guangdongensis TaxID=510515 RepID=A0ABV3ZSG1_9BURK
MSAATEAQRANWWGDARSGKLPANLLGFGRALRRAGIPVDAERLALAQQSLVLTGMAKQDVAAALEAVLVSREQDLVVFRELFAAYFRNPEVAQQLLGQLLPRSPEAARPRHRPRVQEALAAIRAAGRPGESRDEPRLDAAMSASERRRLQHADFEQLSASEYRLVQQLVRDIRLPLPSYRSRRSELHVSGSRVHWPASLKAAARSGGELAQLRWLRHKHRPMPWLALVDVSGSMERYVRLLLAFLHQASSPRRHPGLSRHVYSMGTSLRDLNSAFALADPDAMLARVNAEIDDFGGGTRLGECLAQLHRQAARHLVGRRTLVLLVSDGLDTGEPQLLERELQWLGRHSARIVWLNPLLRFDGYAPLARGAAVLHRHTHAMLAVHNLESLQQLARHLARLLQAGDHHR